MTKRRLRELLAARRFAEIVAAAAGSRRVLSDLLAATYDPDPEIGWRAVAVMGRAAARIADRDPASVREHLRRLHWTLHEESGGVCWRAPEAMGEIVRRRPVLFGDYVPIVVHLLDELADEDLTHFRAGVLWAIGRLGALAADPVAEVLPAMVAALADPTPQVRGAAAWALGEVGRGGLLAGHPELMEDRGPVDHFARGSLRRTTVERLARRALAARRPGRAASRS